MAYAERFTGAEILDLIEIRDDQLLYTKRWPWCKHQPGDPVPIVQHQGKPHFQIQGRRYRPKILVEAVNTRNAALIDSRQRKLYDELTPRDMEMYEHMLKGTTYADIGAMYGLSRQRIRQVAEKLASKGYVTTPKRARMEARAAAHQQMTLSKYGRSFDDVCNNPALKADLERKLRNKRSNAQQRGIEFSITISDLYPLPERCPVLDIPLRYDVTGYDDNAASIDRINPDRGYVPGNIIVVSTRANRIKNDATPDELHKVASFYASLTLGEKCG